MAIPADKEKLFCCDMKVTWSLGVDKGDSSLLWGHGGSCLGRPRQNSQVRMSTRKDRAEQRESSRNRRDPDWHVPIWRSSETRDMPVE